MQREAVKVRGDRPQKHAIMPLRCRADRGPVV